MSNKIRFIQRNALGLIIGLMAVFLSSCNTTKYLSGDETLLVKNDIVILDDMPRKDKKRIKTNLSFFFRQNPNGTKFGMPREYLFYKNNKPADTTKINKWARETLGQPPAIYNNARSEESVVLMEQFLKYKKGYYDAKVDYLEEIIRRKTKVRYLVRAGDRYTIKSIKYVSKDSIILKNIEAIKDESLIQVGDPIDSDVFDLEKNRITKTLQNQGYADFVGQYLDIKGDSINNKNAIDIFIEIFPPEGKTQHTIYHTGNVSVFTDYYSKQDTIAINGSSLNGIKYFRESRKYLVKPRVIEKAIYFSPGEVTKRDPRLKTLRKLSTLSAYRFSSIYPKANTTDSTLIDYDITLVPHQKKWIADGGFDVYYSTVAQFGNLIGLSFNGQLIDRNFLGGSEQYTLSGEVGTEVTLSSPIIARTVTTSLNNKLQIPRFSDPLKTFRGLNKLHLLPTTNYERFLSNAKTELNLGANYTRVINNLSIKTLSGSVGYSYSDGAHHQIGINQLSLSINDYLLEGDLNPFTEKSFQDNLLTGFIFSDLLYIYNKKSAKSKITRGLLTNFEVSGLEIFLANKIANQISGNTESWTLGNSRFQFAKFVKFDIDGRLSKDLTPKRSFATRLYSGIIVPYGDNAANPYIKQFNVGGPNSLRGWRQRQIGPGSNSNNILDDYPIQQADIKLEANIEYRFDMGSIVEGAFFLDAGNIWNIKNNGQSGEQFSSKFYRQIAVAGGYGIRFDFDYFLIRFDFGYKLRNPYKDAERNKYWYNFKGIRNQKLGNLQIAINYPF